MNPVSLIWDGAAAAPQTIITADNIIPFAAREIIPFDTNVTSVVSIPTGASVVPAYLPSMGAPTIIQNNIPTKAVVINPGRYNVPGQSMFLSFNSTENYSGDVFYIAGICNGGPIVETIVGPAANATVTSVNAYSQINSISSRDALQYFDITVATVRGSTGVISWDMALPASIYGYQFTTVSGTVSITPQYTLQSIPFYVTDILANEPEYRVNWVNFPFPAGISSWPYTLLATAPLTSTVAGGFPVLDTPMGATRFLVTSASSGHFKVYLTQQGVRY